MRPRRSNQIKLPPCLPNDVLHDSFDLVPSWQEVEFDRYHHAKAIYQQEWMREAVKRLVEIGIEIERDKLATTAGILRAQLATEQAREQDRIDLWFREQALKESEANKKFLQRCQDELDGPYLKAQLAKLARVEKEIRTGLAKIEKDELLRRGVYRGRK